jgi:uncharacterized HAD superfamily protein
MNSKQHPLYGKWRYIQDTLSGSTRRECRVAKKLGLTCDWSNFQSFSEDIEQHLGLPKKDQQLVRKDMRKGWTLNNLHYATAKRKAQLQRTCIVVKYKNKKMCAKELAAAHNLNYATVLSRIYKGWTMKQIIQPPLK